MEGQPKRTPYKNGDKDTDEMVSNVRKQFDKKPGEGDYEYNMRLLDAIHRYK